ncbi:hypothetical protein SUVZ_07G2650 [Saccharomyces uvarum]|uniref:Sulfhydryl oxidase n=1 Tax=Saccharomyces uvarum TaxID=230603 RepID=A0ABN8WTD1_SACUV|nr:hypothetical protein SUVZ_07G2650 [Saccharomyces uvarum]
MTVINRMTNNSPQEGLSGRQIMYDEDGKPCRSCNTLLDFQYVTGKITNGLKNLSSNATLANTAAATATSQDLIPGSRTYTKVDPPDVEQLGRSSWTLLHAAAANYPVKPSDEQKGEMKQFLNIFSHIYPCNWCAKDFEKYIRENAPKIESREELGRWMCEAHNKVNTKLRKPKFDCNFWGKRWKDGWDE